MSTQPLKSLRVIALASGHPEIRKVNILATNPSDIHHAIKQYLQLTAAQASVQHHETVMPTASTDKTLRTIFISGYVGPS